MKKKNSVKTKKDKTRLTAIGLFCGCGGLDLGFQLAGYEILYANDFDKSVKETYAQNIGPIEIADICKVDKNLLPRADIILAGIPCQPFSNAGNRGSINDARGGLFNEVVKLLKIQKPKVVLFENVRGFLSAKDNEGRKMPERMEVELKAVGYKFYYKLLNAADYNVPQNRHRVVMIGIRKDIDKGFEFPSPKTFKTGGQFVGTVIEKPLPLGEKQELWDLSPQSKKIIKYIPEGGSWKNIPDKHLPGRLKKIREQMQKYRSPNFYRRFSRVEVMGTVTAAATPENSGILHPLENRRYSVREIARFQSFPDNFHVARQTNQPHPMLFKLLYNFGF